MLPSRRIEPSVVWPFADERAVGTNRLPAPLIVFGHVADSKRELVDPYAYAISFWYDAALVVLLSEPCAVDFVRHRTRQVARELANLLPMLEPDPDAPAAIRRKPPTMPNI